METAEPPRGDALELGDGLVDVDEGHVPETDQAGGRGLRQLHHPVVVAGDDVAAERRVGRVLRDRSAEVEHLGVDAVEVHVLEAGLGVVRARSHVLVGEAHSLELLRRAAGGRVEADAARDLRVDDPEVTLRRRLDAGHAVLEPLGRVARPEVLRRVHVRVGGDEALRGHRSLLRRQASRRRTSSPAAILPARSSR